MQPEFWIDVISRLGNVRVFELDDLFDLPTQSTADNSPGKNELDHVRSHPSRVFWEPERDDALVVGIRVTKRLDNPTDLAGHLAAMAAERGITPIILTKIGACGLERFGFRIEDISVGSGIQSEKLEEQVKRFWHIDIVIDAADVNSFS